MVKPMTLTWIRRYGANAAYCETEGWVASSPADVRQYLVETVRLEWQRWLTLNHSTLQSLAEAGFSPEVIQQVLRSGRGDPSGTALQGDFGEVFASLFLTSQFNMQFPWPTFWDRRTPEASLSGGDLVGLARDEKGAVFVIGQVKSSTENRHPPTVVYHRKHGLVAQLERLRCNHEHVLSHLKWLLIRAEGASWQENLFHALSRVTMEQSDLLVIGVLVRDCHPSEADLRRAHSAFAETPGARVLLLGCYLPVSWSSVFNSQGILLTMEAPMPARWQVGESARGTLGEAQRIANLRLVRHALEVVRIRDEGEVEQHRAEEELLAQAAHIAEMMCLDLLSQDQATDPLTEETRQACEVAFKILRWMSLPEDWRDQLKWALKVACLGLLAERTADTKHWLRELGGLLQTPDAETWADRVFSHITGAFLRDIRQQGWDDLDSVVLDIQALREAQEEYEAVYLKAFGDTALELPWSLSPYTTGPSRQNSFLNSWLKELQLI